MACPHDFYTGSVNDSARGNEVFMAIKAVTVLGATGSIGASTLDVINRHPDRYRLFAVTANTGADKLFDLVVRFRPRYAVLRDELAAEQLHGRLRVAGIDTEVLAGDAGLIQVAAHPQVDAVMAAIVGAAGLAPTLAAVQAGKQVLLVNKEALVMAGHLFMDAVAASGGVLLPVDSEHNAIFQCLPGDFRRGLNKVGVRKILLTGSGGPFRNTPIEQLASVTPAAACAHPNWSMGPKISVDSATMMNKGLELIEACWLFDAKPEQVQIVIHPQSVIHSMVEYIDGSVLAQLGNPDMRTPIAHALAWPERIDSGVASLDLIATARLDFQAPDYQRFPCLALAAQALHRGGTAPAVLNAANEEAVAAFLDGRLRFTDIAAVIEQVLGRAQVVEPHSLADVQQADSAARRDAVAAIAAAAPRS
jgi:1-deoxy-D-xylulose-5-phosphate reductoisomerase